MSRLLTVTGKLLTNSKVYYLFYEISNLSNAHGSLRLTFIGVK